ncbi:helix-turn-helix transcriptional regulator [Mesorhizobium sangaii]|uniref:Putative DNA-binding transcriptional regulator AlpA n=1 Tax=Mesorhizobium sangaii TaxID=505389 RepID=A0A841P383_9HYPH|nr:DNA-binding protein [Mesorhizobium sangaii]MBB6407643.1 putative DNA-binding transcriptional regulator AlpA [Mesorhizobium sangaii]
MEITVQAPQGAGFLPARRVWERYGVTSMTLHRWLNDQRIAFPKPVYIGRFRYFKLAEIEAWERTNASSKAVAA